jgi:hypothetical protein
VTKSSHHAHATEPVDYDLTCWYLNRRRVLELVGIEAAYQTTGLSGRMALNAELVALKNALVAWLNFNKPPTLGQLLIKGKLTSIPLTTQISLERDCPLLVALSQKVRLMYQWPSYIRN